LWVAVALQLLLISGIVLGVGDFSLIYSHNYIHRKKLLYER